MRRILIHHARRRGRAKRGGGRIQVTLGDVQAGTGLPLEDLLALDEAIQRLEGQDPRMAEIVPLRFFAGLSVDETANALEPAFFAPGLGTPLVQGSEPPTLVERDGNK
jgi:hypothetical protein